MKTLNDFKSQKIQVESLEYSEGTVIVNGEIWLNHYDGDTYYIPESWIENFKIKSLPDDLFFEMCDSNLEPLQERIMVARGDAGSAAILFPPTEIEEEIWGWPSIDMSVLDTYDASYINGQLKKLIEKQKKFDPFFTFYEYEPEDFPELPVSSYEYHISIQASTVKEALQKGRKFKSDLEKLLVTILEKAKQFIETEINNSPLI